MDTGEQRDVAQHVGGQCVMNGHELRVGPARRTGAEPIRHLFKQAGKEADALGRGLEPYDMPVVRAIRKEAAQDNYRFSAIVKAIVNSAPFTMKEAVDTSGAQVATK